MVKTPLLCLGLVLGLAACGDDGARDDTANSDTAVSDSGTTGAVDSGPPDAADDSGPPDVADDSGPPDAADTTPDPDAPEDTVTDAEPETGGDDVADAAPDTLVPLPGFGTITGECGVLDAELTSPEPSFFITHFDFGTDPYDDADLELLSEGAQEIWADGNAGGSSIKSEMFAFELLARCEGATLVKTENEVTYTDAQSKKTDMILIIDDLVVAANPTRAIGFPFDAPYTDAQAKTVLEKKLNDINNSTLHVSQADRWVKQILIVFAWAEGHVANIEAAYATIDAALKADTIVIVSVTDGEDRFIYTD